MSLLSNLFKRKNENMPELPTAFPVHFNGKGIYKKIFDNIDAGVVFEDDGETGYFYATNKKQLKVFDGLQLYNYTSEKASIPLGEVFIVLNNSLKKAGIYYNDEFQAIFDFNLQKGSCRIGKPIKGSADWECSHKWDEQMVKGLEPNS